jgi:hypothetical protein
MDQTVSFDQVCTSFHQFMLKFYDFAKKHEEKQTLKSPRDEDRAPRPE